MRLAKPTLRQTVMIIRNHDGSAKSRTAHLLFVTLLDDGLQKLSVADAGTSRARYNHTFVHSSVKASSQYTVDMRDGVSDLIALARTVSTIERNKQAFIHSA